MSRAQLRILPTHKLKLGYFTIEALNSFSTVFYVYYLYFFMQTMFGWGNKANLVLAAVNGLVYMVGSICGGNFAQRFGYFTSLSFGFFVMSVALALGPHLSSAPGQILVAAVVVGAMGFTWPALEALVSEGEPAEKVPAMVGMYNVVWAATGALAYFTGGAIIEKWGRMSMFYVPLAMQLFQFAMTIWLSRRAPKHSHISFGEAKRKQEAELLLIAGKTELHQQFSVAGKPKVFLRMAWLANPCAYIAINTLIAVIPGVASRLHLTTALAGVFCSLWCFARLAAFLALWQWEGWHYRFRWLLVSYVGLIAAFAAILMAGNLVVLLGAQMVFGAAIGLIYSSSLFYSMDASDTKGEHGGLHEAAIGFGNFAGPALGAASLHYLPQYANIGALTVSGLLFCGFIGLIAIWRTGKHVTSPDKSAQTFQS